MSDKPETLAAILADMRNPPHKWEGFSRADLARLADRIEAAAERERTELLRQLRNEIEINNALATVRPQFHYVDDVIAEAAKERAHEIELAKLRAPGNAAAMRDALERIVNLAPEYPARGVDWNALAAEAFLTASSALSSPARNCDKFATADDARDAAKKEFANTMLLDDRQLRAVCDWLFAPAAKEGGAE